MRFNDHNDLEGQHAFLSPSGYHWINYEDSKLVERYSNYRASLKGTELHELASGLIKNKIKLADHKKAINQFVNDCIGFRMDSEVPLYYSQNCFGTADAISFKDNKLMIFDLKTGKTKAVLSSTDVNEISVDPADGSMEVNSLAVDKLQDTADVSLVLNGGDSTRLI